MATLRPGRTAALTAAAMTAFAANSLLCRSALAAERIDAVTFTVLRVASGAAMLALLAHGRDSRSTLAGGPDPGGPTWPAAAALFAYALAFSLAYVRIPAGTGALLLFGAVQVTMVGHAVLRGARLRPGEWVGLALAVSGLVVLTRPGLTAPDPAGTALMTAAGVAWGIYTLLGRAGGDPLRVNAGNFLRATLPAAGAGAVAVAAAPLHWSATGAGLAVASGAVTSGIGYAIWYAALPGLTGPQAAIVQLSAPVLAAAGGVLLLSEAFTTRLLGSAALVLGGIALAVLVRSKE